MSRDIEAVPIKRNVLGTLWRSAFDAVRLHFGFAFLGLVCLGFSAMSLVLYAVLPRKKRRRVGRLLIAWAFRFYLRVLSLIGACRFDFSELDTLNQSAPAIIAPNHPSLLDAVMILSRLPQSVCIMKADIINSVFFGAGARLGGYIRNIPLRTMIQLAASDLQEGGHVLLFPEGTRTNNFPVGSMQGTVGLLAKHSGVPVQTVFIETSSGFLGKGWSPLWVPKMPIIYRIRLGKRFEPPSHTAHFASELEAYFTAELARAELPKFPVSSPDA